MFRAFILIHDGYPARAAGLELVLREMFDTLRINGTANWYYDEFVENGTEYGVRVEVSDISADTWQQLLIAIERYASKMYGEVSVEVS